jgi:NitT/TauT family transport system substrate-binding protein
MFTRARRASCCALTAAAVALLVSSCTGSSASSSSANLGSSGPISITVGALPIVDDVALHIAADQGFFQQVGLNVHIQAVANSKLAIPMMAGGKMDIISGANYVTFIQASLANKAAPYSIVAEGASCAPGAFEVMALPNSGIKTPADLAGKTIAVNLTKNIQTLMIDSDLGAYKADPKVNYVAIPFPSMLAALTSHRVDAIGVVEPFASAAEQTAAAVPILDLCTGPTASFPLSGYIALSSWAQRNPDAVHRFQAAIARAQQVADTDRGEVEKALTEYIPHLSATQAAILALDQFPVSSNTAQLNRVSDLMQQAGLIKSTSSFHAASLIAH